MMIKGVDVSHWQGDIDFQRLKDQGYEFAMIKATQGTWFVDPRLRWNVQGFESVGMGHGLYHFLDPVQDGYQNGNEQLEFFHENTVGLHGQLPNALDVEWQAELTDTELSDLVVDFLQSAALRWLLYSNLNFLNNIIEYPDLIAQEADIWLAWPSRWFRCKMPTEYEKDLVKIWQWDWSGGLDKNRVLDEVWYYSHVPPVTYKVVRIISPPGVVFDIKYE